eukprot:9356249-Alexandrium_andersonii.AAC.1
MSASLVGSEMCIRDRSVALGGVPLGPPEHIAGRTRQDRGAVPEGSAVLCSRARRVHGPFPGVCAVPGAVAVE